MPLQKCLLPEACVLLALMTLTLALDCSYDVDCPTGQCCGLDRNRSCSRSDYTGAESLCCRKLSCRPRQCYARSHCAPDERCETSAPGALGVCTPDDLSEISGSGDVSTDDGGFGDMEQ
ncbi:uncharacterized protein LOC101860374 [Aplysia californica]|uniref:Uncharacterized protein LOC101860374 n=1 Tax=Aplysia californica TaxID=6500 RepID=A0ABM0K7B7_APLCA|nr:uncharacterized protein LOC101860374 [Aplysia californica]